MMREREQSSHATTVLKVEEPGGVGGLVMIVG